MLQYLLNLTAIWLISLALFDVLLKKESYHQYNRLYLLLTFCLGLLLPLWQWGGDSIVFHTPALAPYTGIAATGETIVTTAIPRHTAADNTNWALIIYCSGVVITMAILLLDIFKLIRLHHSGRRYKYNNINIIETGKGHAPFSLFNTIYISSRDSYSDVEWDMLIHHEWQHFKKLHFVDLFVMQLARIIFWFHPLVYIYYHRLIMVHEYQSDSFYNSTPQVYGKFLVEQSLLQNTPQITHSFNRSPIKNRIIMLTKKSKRYSRLKLLIVAPLTLGCLLCFTKTGYSFKRDSKNSNIVTFRGNQFEFGFDDDAMNNPKNANKFSGTNNPPTKTVQIRRSSDITVSSDKSTTGKQDVKMSPAPESIIVFAPPLKMNGNKIYSDEAGIKTVTYTGKDGSLSHYLFSNTEKYLSKLNNGKYWVRMGYTVIDETGKVVYYENKGIVTADDRIALDAALKQQINEQFARSMDDAPAFTPAIYNGKAVTSYIPWGFEGTIVVKDHKATYTPPHYTELK